MDKKSYILLFFIALIFSFSCIQCKKIVIEKPDVGGEDTTGSSIICSEIQDASKKFYTTIPNLDFEYWKISSSKKYYDPEPSCFWATPNKSRDIINTIPATVFRVGHDSAYSGKYAAMIRTGKWASLIVGGTIASGDFKPNLSNPLQSISFGKGYKKRPKTISGYYKYYPVAGDSCSVYCFVTKQKTVSGKKITDTLGFANMVSTATVTTYTKFDLPLKYKSAEIPDRIVIYFASSEGASQLLGQEGSTMFIDEVKLTY